MTNEEFTGHLLAALHGPKANEIAGRVVQIVVQEIEKTGMPGLEKELDEFAKVVVGDTEIRLVAIETLLLLRSLRPSDTEEIMRVSQAIILLEEKLGASVRPTIDRAIAKMRGKEGG